MDIYELDASRFSGNDRIIADDFSLISKNCCRKCHRPIKPYSERFYEIDGCDGFFIHREKSARNNYCKKCAKTITAKSHAIRLPKVIKTYETIKDGKLAEIREFDNGVLEETSFNERNIVLRGDR